METNHAIASKCQYSVRVFKGIHQQPNERHSQTEKYYVLEYRMDSFYPTKMSLELFTSLHVDKKYHRRGHAYLTIRINMGTTHFL